MLLYHTLAVVSNIKTSSRRGRVSENITGKRPQRGPTSELGSIFTCPDIRRETITDRHKFEPQHDLIEPTCCQIRRQTVNCRVASSKRLSPTSPGTVCSLSSGENRQINTMKIEKNNKTLLRVSSGGCGCKIRPLPGASAPICTRDTRGREFPQGSARC